MRNLWPPPNAYCSRPTAFEEPQVRRAGPALLLSADCSLHLREAGRRGLFAGMPDPGAMSPPAGKEKTGNFQK